MNVGLFLGRLVGRKCISLAGGRLSPTRFVVYVRPRTVFDTNSGFFAFGDDYARAVAFAAGMRDRRYQVFLYAELNLPEG